MDPEHDKWVHEEELADGAGVMLIAVLGQSLVILMLMLALSVDVLGAYVCSIWANSAVPSNPIVGYLQAEGMPLHVARPPISSICYALGMP